MPERSHPVRRLFAAAVLTAAGTAAVLAADFPAARQFQTVEVAPGVVAFIAAETSGPIPSGNVVAIIGDEAVLVVDSGRFPTLARRMVAEIRKRTDKPVRYLVHTHWHLDHIVADAVFREAWPGITFVSTEFTRRKIADKQVAYV
ncbi:MAG TPA: MBL fold metallo-hydrolase, partial [Thermoanaerobaculia bacterium]|nr:MBL fold metallo-hydrolase [Thermoanaerobaculia bacterium]